RACLRSFCTGPAPTEIYALSLHDALPIWFEMYIGGAEIFNGFSELNDPLDQRARFEAQASLRSAGDEEAQQIDEDYLRALEYGIDRKSTRLNSSHVKISYAVFCLKKKTDR